ncbi:MAG: ribonuclease E/G, partial [Mycobacteriales bacterium]
IIVVDFIDMVLESNRDLVVRRLVECLGRDRTKHQVAEVTSLGLVQMTRKRVGQGLLESFSETCEACNGRGVKIHTEPVDPKPHREERDRAPKVGPRAPLSSGPAAEEPAATTGGRNKRRRGGRGGGSGTAESGQDVVVESADFDVVPEADVAEQETPLVGTPEEAPVEVREDVPIEDALEQSEEVVLEPDAVPVLEDDAPYGEAELTAEPVASEPAEPVKKRRRAAVRPAGSPTR